MGEDGCLGRSLGRNRDFIAPAAAMPMAYQLARHNDGMKTEIDRQPASALDPNGGQAAINRRRALAWLGYGLAGGAALAGGYWGWARQQHASAAKFSQHPLSDVHLQALDGSSFDAAAFLAGQAVVLNFWAPWCPPCVEELPIIDAELAHLAAKTGKTPSFLAIALDDLAPVQRFWQASQLRHITPVVAGYAGMALLRSLGNSTGQLPFTVVLAGDGAILHSHLGALNAADVQKILTLLR